MLDPSEAIERLTEAGVHRVEMRNAQPFTTDIVLADTDEAKAAELISHYQRRVQDLLETNNRYLERARAAEAILMGLASGMAQPPECESKNGDGEFLTPPSNPFAIVRLLRTAAVARIDNSPIVPKFTIEETIEARAADVILDLVKRLHRLEVAADAQPMDQADQWNESARGKKMSDASGRVIYKYEMPVLERFTMKLPSGAEIIRVTDQDGKFWLWAVVRTDVPDEERYFLAFKTGAKMPDDVPLRYVGFCAVFVQMELGLYIFEEIADA